MWCANTMMLISIVTAMVPSSSSVVAALRLFGLRKAGTPFEIASTPVSAAQPDENARASRKIRASPVRFPPSYPGAGMMWKFALSTSGSCPSEARNAPTSAMPSTPAMKQYVGTAKKAPDSRTPLRFVAASARTSTTATATSWCEIHGTAAAAFWTPDETDTATVRT